MRLIILCLILTLTNNIEGQNNIGDFISVTPASQSTQFVFPDGFRFQEIISSGDALTEGGNISGNHDFTGYVPIANSSSNGYLSINKEGTPGGVTILDINLNASKLWMTTASEAVDFNSVAGTARNCSGTVTPWNTIVTCEETTSSDGDMDGYNDLGWCVEVNPVTKTVINKLWAAGNFKHENIVVHANQRTMYQGADSNPGYLFKFVADVAADLNSGLLYVYKGSKSGSGNWILLNNSTQSERNSTLTQCTNVSATVFNGIEDVEIGPDGKVYFAVKGESRVYRFDDSDPITGTTVSNMETFVGGMNYDIESNSGTTSIPWGAGNDNLAFDNEGNLWVLQDGGNNYIWVVKNGHTQVQPLVELFGISPSGSEPTGITFSPDYKYLFMSIQHPSSGNNSSVQLDAAGNSIAFDENISIVIAKSENLGMICLEVGNPCDDGDSSTFEDVVNVDCNCEGSPIQQTNNYMILSSNDDVEEDIGTGNVYATSTDLEMTYDQPNDEDQIVGVRFIDVVVPDGKLIEEAYIQFTVDETSTSATNLSIKAHLTANAAAFNTSNNADLSSRPLTTTEITWSNVPSWTIVGESGVRQRTPNLAELINEIRFDTNWLSGNAMAFLIEGSGNRIAESYDGDSSKAAKLVIKYVEPNKNNIGISSVDPSSKLEVNQGDLYVKSLGSGVIVKSPDGNCWKLVVDNSGVVSSISVACPE